MKYAYLGSIIIITVTIASCSGEEKTTGSTAGNGGNGSSSGDGGSGGEITDAGADVEYQCGVGPGTMGNSKGVGKYCDGFADCSGQEASICAVLGDPTAHFCTKVCNAAMPSDVQCGENAACSCNGGPCGCTPAACSGPDDGGMGTDGGGTDGG